MLHAAIPGICQTKEQCSAHLYLLRTALSILRVSPLQEKKIHHLINFSASVTWIQKASLNHNGLFLVHSTSTQNPQESVLLFFGWFLFVLFFSSLSTSSSIFYNCLKNQHYLKRKFVKYTPIYTDCRQISWSHLKIRSSMNNLKGMKEEKGKREKGL